MVFDKVLASVQIGAAEVDTIVEDDVLVPCEPVSGKVVVEGGNADQEIEGLEHRVVANAPDGDKHTITIDTHQVAEPFTIHEDEHREIEFEWDLHPQTPVTEFDVEQNRVEVWVDTGLAIDKAIDSSDKDYLKVAPTEAIQATVDAMDELGLELFRLTADEDWLTVDLDREDDPEVGAHYDQEFDFRETDRYDGPSFNEYQLHFLPSPSREETDILIELEQYSGGDVFEEMTVDHDDLDVEGIADRLQEKMAALS